MYWLYSLQYSQSKHQLNKMIYMIWVPSKVYENDSKVLNEGKKVNITTFQKWREITCKENVHNWEYSSRQFLNGLWIKRSDNVLCRSSITSLHLVEFPTMEVCWNCTDSGHYTIHNLNTENSIWIHMRLVLWNVLN